MDELSTHTVLIVDDDPNNIEILTTDLEDEGYTILTASDGVEGWEVLQAHKDAIGCILLDRMMPNMDGMEYIAKLKADASVARKPVIMQTAAAEHSQVAEGIRAGVYYYLTKPYEVEVMLSVVRAAITDYADYSSLLQELEQFKRKLHLIRESTFEVYTLEDVRYLSTFLANHYPDPGRIILGLSEMLTNAIEHGNLGITYEEKSALLKGNRWEDEVIRRQALPEYAGRKVTVHFKREQDHIDLTITDEGDGFEWDEYMNISPDRATHSHGRGIALSNMMSFDSIDYQGKGNQVLCRVAMP
jgi:CheY-like chemotaxis protein